MRSLITAVSVLLFSSISQSAVRQNQSVKKPKTIRKFRQFKKDYQSSIKTKYSPPVFDFPVTYNSKVKMWINYYQTRGKNSFKRLTSTREKDFWSLLAKESNTLTSWNSDIGISKISYDLVLGFYNYFTWFIN